MKTAWCLSPLLLIASGLATAADDHEVRWLKVLLQGQQIGQVEHSRRVVGDTVINTERFEVSLSRAGTTISVRTEESSRETLTGTPLGFSTLTEMGGIAQRAEGTIAADGKVEVSFSQGGDVRSRQFAYPRGALMAEGARLLEERKNLKPGEAFKFRAFMPSQLEAVDVGVKFIGEEDVEIDGRTVKGRHIEQTLLLSTGPIVLQSWTDADGQPLRSEMPMFGMKLEIVLGDEASAAHRDDPTDLFTATVIAAPRALTAAERRADITYALAVTDPKLALEMPSDEQQLTRAGEEWRLRVDLPPYAEDALTTPVGADALEASPWVQSDAPEIVEFAKAATKDAGDAHARMRALQAAVSRRITSKNLRIGYASALEAWRMREGDCTEHALLLAAAGRAIGIPTRVAVGLAYIDSFAGHERAFVPHAWTQARIDGRWTSFDAALGGFDSGHIALAAGSGEPAMFYGSINLLGNLKITAIRALAP